MNVRSLIVGLLVLPCAAPTLSAGVMLSPTAVLGTDLGTFDPSVPLENMINQSSLDKAFTSGVTDFDEYFTTGAQPFGQGGPGNWQSNFTFNLPLTGFVDFDLGAVHSIERLAIWNRSLENIEILVSETLGGPMTSAGNFVLTNHLNFPFSYVPQILELNGAVDARYLRIDISSAYKFDVSDTFAYAIVGEVVVETLPAAPILTADFDEDLDVDVDDLANWKTGFGVSGSATHLQGDADGDLAVDGGDFLAWQRQFTGAAAASIGAVAIPEPATTLMLLTGVLATVFRHCRSAP